uniref:Zinc finger protein 346 n=1 Tax=Equus asinus TaxID=9793 RepID=A0A9L0KEB0_EQUAS
MEYPALGAAEAADSGGARLYNSSEEREGREPDGLRFDREKARRLWEAVSGAQPVGREEVEHMIQKNQCLFTNTQCKVCCALLISESQKLAHYQSKKHANKVKRYLAIHGMETLKGETKKLDSDQKSSRSKDKNQCCPICNMTFSSPVVAQSHYLGKTHAKNLKLKQQSTKVEALHQNREMIDPDKFCSLCHATFNDPVMAQQHYVGKKHRKQETKLKLMAHYGRLADPAVTDSSAGKGYPCKTCKIVLNSIEQYQAHVSGFKHKNHSSSEFRPPFTTQGKLMSGRLMTSLRPYSYLKLHPGFKPLWLQMLLCHFQRELFILTLWNIVRVRDNICEVLGPIRGAVRDKLSFIQQIFIKHLLCAKPCFGHWGYSRNQYQCSSLIL